MKIETEFDKGDNVFFMHENKVVEDKVKKITIIVEEGEKKPKVSYDLTETVQENGSSMRKEEGELYATKAELIETL